MLIFFIIVESFCFTNEGRIPEKYTKDGQDESPSFHVFEIPENTKSIAIICDDPDSKSISGKTWIHWIIYNIKVQEKELKIYEDFDEGNFGVNSFLQKSYDGPSPPAGTGIHHYFFKFYALNDTLKFLFAPKIDDILIEIKRHLIDKVEIVGTYSRI